MSKIVFRGRAFVSLLMVFGIVAVTLSGIALYAAPRGWAGAAQEWRFLFLGKRDWSSIHTVFGLLFPAAALVHIWLNRKPLAGYIKKRVTEAVQADWPGRLRLELVAALAVSVFLFLSALWSFPPASTLLEWRAVMSERGGAGHGNTSQNAP